MRQFVAEHPLPPLPPDIPTARETIKQRGLDMASLLKVAPFSALAEKVNVIDTKITLPEVPCHEFGIRTYEPRTRGSEPLPVLLWFHGGMWCAGDVNTEDFGCRAIVTHGAEVVIISFEYRLAPEYRWETVFSDAEDAMKWTFKNASTHGGDPGLGFIIGGANAGAHLAAMCVIRARNRHPHINITGQLLIVPILMAQHPDDDNIPAAWVPRLSSHVDCADAPLLDETAVRRYVDALGLPEGEKRNGENMPMWVEDPTGLPPAYLAMDEVDPIRDDGFLYEHLLWQAGVKTRVDYYRGLPNMFVQFPTIPQTFKAGIHLSAGVKWLLDQRRG